MPSSAVDAKAGNAKIEEGKWFKGQIISASVDYNVPNMPKLIHLALRRVYLTFSDNIRGDIWS
jgi:hypothetical protein